MQRPEEIFAKALARAGRSSAMVGIEALVPEASTRRYYRLNLTDGSALVGVLEPIATAAENFGRFAAIRDFLALSQVNVPEIYFADAAAGVMLQQDLGPTDLNQLLKTDPANTQRNYEDAIQHMFRWQRSVREESCPAFSLSFDQAKLMFEFDFFLEHTLTGFCGATESTADIVGMRTELVRIAEELGGGDPMVFTHRDYHSRNIMITSEPAGGGTKQHIIDFQDARLGLFHYDLSSLLCDAYAPLGQAERDRLLQIAYADGKTIHQQAKSEFDHFWRLSAFQRIVKAMGTFGRQALLGRQDFALYLKPAATMLTEITPGDIRLEKLAKNITEVLAGYHA
jgi:N-acetylmuramate 1-kinase